VRHAGTTPGARPFSITVARRAAIDEATIPWLERSEDFEKPTQLLLVVFAQWVREYGLIHRLGGQLRDKAAGVGAEALVALSTTVERLAGL
jgi:hypothetical protein